MGREKELSIHFVPGDCRLVEVRELARVSRGGETSRGNRVRRAGRVCWRGLEWFSRRIFPESEAPGDEGGAAEFVYLGAHSSVFCLSAPATGSS